MKILIGALMSLISIQSFAEESDQETVMICHDGKCEVVIIIGE